MRTILLVPRTGARWHELVVRMQEKPDPFSSNPLTDDEVPYVTAYLVAITPDIQASRKRKVEQERTREQVEQKTVAAMAMPATPATAAAGAESLVVDQAKGKAILDSRCMDCHELDEIESFGGADIAGWSKVITDMVEEGAEITEEEARTLAPYLASIYAKQ
jgi:mono/diheme cytochrome c family protein